MEVNCGFIDIGSYLKALASMTMLMEDLRVFKSQLMKDFTSGYLIFGSIAFG